MDIKYWIGDGVIIDSNMKIHYGEKIPKDNLYFQEWKKQIEKEKGCYTNGTEN